MEPEKIKEFRKQLALSQQDFSALIGVSVGTVNNWEKGLRKPSKMAMHKLKQLITQEAKS